jgi:hypothetical protein
MTDHIRELEERLRLAMLASNVRELDVLIDDELLFVGPDGNLYSKAEDLELYRSGAQRLAYLEWEQQEFRLHGTACVGVVTAFVALKFRGEPVSGRFRYSRTWLHRDGQWRIVSGSVAAVAPE